MLSRLPRSCVSAEFRITSVTAAVGLLREHVDVDDSSSGKQSNERV